MKTLPRTVGGIYNQLQPRMPAGIHARADYRVALHVHLFDFSIVCNDGSALKLSCMELHALRIIVLVVMAVDTLSVLFRSAEHVVVDDAFIIILQAALVDGQFLISDI